MLQNGSLILASALLLCGNLTCPAADAYSETLREFLRYEPDEFGAMLDNRRPLPVTPEVAASTVAALPRQGEVTQLTVSDVRKLESVPAVLRPHGREQVYLIKVVDSRQARVGLHDRFVVLITHTALRILSPVQLQAMVAHEIGHEYVWDEYAAARETGNKMKLRALELFCDGVATITLARIGAAPGALVEALRVMDASDRLNGLVVRNNTYPSVAERADFARQLVKWLGGRRSSLSHQRLEVTPQQ